MKFKDEDSQKSKSLKETKSVNKTEISREVEGFKPKSPLLEGH